LLHSLQLVPTVTKKETQTNFLLGGTVTHRLIPKATPSGDSMNVVNQLKEILSKRFPMSKSMPKVYQQQLLLNLEEAVDSLKKPWITPSFTGLNCLMHLHSQELSIYSILTHLISLITIQNLNNKVCNKQLEASLVVEFVSKNALRQILLSQL
jgi:hypothetical protein